LPFSKITIEKKEFFWGEVSKRKKRKNLEGQMAPGVGLNREGLKPKGILDPANERIDLLGGGRKSQTIGKARKPSRKGIHSREIVKGAWGKRGQEG